MVLVGVITGLRGVTESVHLCILLDWVFTDAGIPSGTLNGNPSEEPTG